MNYPFHPTWKQQLSDIAVQAGALIMQVRGDALQVEKKPDNSLVTQADTLADAYICEQLRLLTPDIPIVSEEGDKIEGDTCFWCVDPLDGTKGFVRGGEEFTVNIALIYEGLPVIGVIYVPPTGELYRAAIGKWAEKQLAGKVTALSVVAPQAGAVKGILSHYHNPEKAAAIQARFGIDAIVTASSSLKFCRIAEGSADIYPRFGTTMEWDTAAGHAIVKAAGGRVTVMESDEELRYCKEGFVNPHFVAWGGMK